MALNGHGTMRYLAVAMFNAGLAVGAAAMLVSADDGLAAESQNAEGTPAARQAKLNELLTTGPSDAVAAQRMTCMFGEEPAKVTEARRAGKDFVLDAADTCVAVLVRTAHDGRLPELYRTLLTQLGGDAGLAEKMPLVIGNAALNGDAKFAIGNGKSADLPPPLAFDAGFSVAYANGDTRATGIQDSQKLKAVTEDCLDVRIDAGTCFSAGYAQGGFALNPSR